MWLNICVCVRARARVCVYLCQTRNVQCEVRIEISCTISMRCILRYFYFELHLIFLVGRVTIVFLIFLPVVIRDQQLTL